MARSEAQVLRAVTKVNDKVRTLTAALETTWRERRDLYAEARTLDPPIPHRRIADAAGTTEAAVMQVVAKAHEAELTAILSDRLNGDANAKQLRTGVKNLVATHGTHEAAVTAARSMPLRQLRAATKEPT